MVIGTCSWCQADIEDGESWVKLVETLSDGAQVKRTLHVPECLDAWRDRTLPMDIRVTVAGGKQ